MICTRKLLGQRNKRNQGETIVYCRARAKTMNLNKAPQSVSKDLTDHGGVQPGLWHGIHVFQQNCCYIGVSNTSTRKITSRELQYRTQLVGKHHSCWYRRNVGVLNQRSEGKRSSGQRIQWAGLSFCYSYRDRNHQAQVLSYPWRSEPREPTYAPRSLLQVSPPPSSFPLLSSQPTRTWEYGRSAVCGNQKRISTKRHLRCKDCH